MHPLCAAAAYGMAVLLTTALTAHRRAPDDLKTMAPAVAAAAVQLSEENRNAVLVGLIGI